MKESPAWHPDTAQYPQLVHNTPSTDIRPSTSLLSVSLSNKEATLTSTSPSYQTLSVRLHIPCYQNTVSLNSPNNVTSLSKKQSQKNFSSLLDEITATGRELGKQHTVTHLHISGEGVKWLESYQLITLIQTINRHFVFLSNESFEYAIDVEPQYTDWSKVALLSELGFNTLFLMMHTTNALLDNLHTRHQLEQKTTSIIDATRAMVFRTLHIALLCNHSTDQNASFLAVLHTITQLYPDRFSFEHEQHCSNGNIKHLNANLACTTVVNHSAIDQAITQLQHKGYTLTDTHLRWLTL